MRKHVTAAVAAIVLGIATTGAKRRCRSSGERARHDFRLRARPSRHNTASTFKPVRLIPAPMSGAVGAMGSMMPYHGSDGVARMGFPPMIIVAASSAASCLARDNENVIMAYSKR